MFNNSKYTKWYFKIVNNSKIQNRVKGEIYYEKHHKIPKSLGGNNTKSNIVLLTGREHYICHLLLTKMCIEKEHHYAMIKAFHILTHSKGIKINSRLFSSRREEYSKACSQYRKGKKLSEETKQKIKENHHDVSGIKNPRYGKKLSEETKIKIIKNRRSFKGNKNPNYGKKHTEETKSIISKHSKEKWDLGSREKIKNTLSKGIYITPWGNFISVTDAVIHKESKFKDKGTIRTKCHKQKDGFYFEAKRSNPS